MSVGLCMCSCGVSCMYLCVCMYSCVLTVFLYLLVYIEWYKNKLCIIGVEAANVGMVKGMIEVIDFVV